MKIGLFCDTFYPMIDGVVVVVDNLARQLAKTNDVVVFVPQNSVYDDSALPYKVVRCRRVLKVPTTDYCLALPYFDFKFKKALKNGKFDIIHVHSPFTIGKCGVKYAHRHKVPVIATIHSQFKKDFDNAIKWKRLSNHMNNNVIKFFNNCDTNWALNERAKFLYENYGVKNISKITPNATDFQYKNYNSSRFYNENTLKIDENSKILLFVGRMNKLKNIFFIIDTLKILDENGFDFKMLFVGDGIDLNSLKNYTNSSGLRKKVLFLGRITDRDELANIYKLAHLFIFPSLYDTSSLVQIEASSQKTPTLFAKDSVTSAQIVDGKNGYLAEPTPEEFAKKIEKIFKNEKQYQAVCENCHKSLYKTWQELADEIEKSYAQLIEEKK